MKKISAISAVISIIFITVLAFTFSNPSDLKTEIPSPAGTTINIHIVGCDDCSNVGYCLDGNKFILVGKCDFSINCEEIGKHEICIKGMPIATCSSVNGGVAKTFECTGFGTIDIKVSCNDPCNCICGDSVKKKK
jgi:hypothetical protein